MCCTAAAACDLAPQALASLLGLVGAFASSALGVAPCALSTALCIVGSALSIVSSTATAACDLAPQRLALLLGLSSAITHCTLDIISGLSGLALSIAGSVGGLVCGVTACAFSLA